MSKHNNISKHFEQSKLELQQLVNEYEVTQTIEKKNEILDFLFSTACTIGGLRISLPKPAGGYDAWKERTGKEWNKYMLMPDILTKVYHRLKSNNRYEAIALFDIAINIIEDGTK